MLIGKPEALLFAFVLGLFTLPALPALPALADEPSTPVFYASDTPARVKRIQTVLREPLKKQGLEFQEAPLSEVVDFLKDEYEIEIQIDSMSLEELGISSDDPVSVNLRNISLGSALRIMLRPFYMTYVVSDEVLLIMSEENALARLTVAVYPVGDLLQRKGGKEAEAATDGESEQAAPAGTSPKKKTATDEADTNGAFGCGGAFGCMEPPSDMVQLIDVIHSTVASDTWVENGGREADMRPLQPGLLIISQTQDVHRQIEQLLAAMRLARKHEFAVPWREEPASTNQGGGGAHGGPHHPTNQPTPATGQPPTEAPPQVDRGGGGAF